MAFVLCNVIILQCTLTLKYIGHICIYIYRNYITVDLIILAVVKVTFVQTLLFIIYK